jgi:carbamoylphosphate synthase large subunit
MPHEIGFPCCSVRRSCSVAAACSSSTARTSFKNVVRQAFDVMPDKPVLIDKFLEDAIELDVDCICDGETTSSAACSSTSSLPACTPATPRW